VNGFCEQISQVYKGNYCKTPRMSKAKTVVLLRQIDGVPSPKLGEDFGIVESEAPTSAPKEGVLVNVLYMSVDPYLRGVSRRTKPNDPMVGFVSGKIVESNVPEFKAGDLFGASLPFTTIQTVSKEGLASVRKLTGYLKEEELSLGIGLLGMPGSTAYAAIDLMKVGETSDERVWISAATGAVGSVAGQIAKNVKHCKLVVGSAGSEEKCALAKKEFGYDACFNYTQAKSGQELTALVKANAPEGIDFYFENVGGDHFTAALKNMRTKGRIAVCGAISKYNASGLEVPQEHLNIADLIYSNIRIEGFTCSDWLMGKKGNFTEDMSKWYHAGLVKSKETFFHGIEKWPEAFAALFKQGGDNLGKVVVKM